MTVGWLLVLSLGVAQVHLQPGAARPGDAVLVTVHGADAMPSGTLGKHALVFQPRRDGYAALTSLSIEAGPGPLELSVAIENADGKQRINGTLDVLPGNFPRRELSIAARFTNPSRKELAWAAADQKAFDEALAVAFTPWSFTSDFAYPRPADITAPYGDQRVLNGKTKSVHYGVDLDGNTGDPIWAANDGVVVMARECFGSGNTVLIDHGGRLFTAYFHLSAFAVKVGDQVKQGQAIGRVGMTGRVTGPHLHFGVKLDGRWVNPLSLLSLQFD